MYAFIKEFSFRLTEYAQIYYPIGHTLIGSGQENDVTFHSHSTTNFTFPFSIEYTTTMSSSAQIITDLVSKCGISGGTASDITVDYDITASRSGCMRNLHNLITFSFTSWLCVCFSSLSRQRSATLPASRAL
ncbi:hypothetical protein JVT61DRAFT_2344 [Boletus reticuloceps]|uniref:Uncharacterized protein n=1 Tax=Boletus reticuloceps TaxID=495285 RepID=A0A8I2YQ28_9AGAM|nr:hypothetical protein JVT61DRAFT_2344 [Boletus reticuloceps]